MSHHKQIFSTMSPRRWRIVQWISGLAIVFLILGIGTLAYSLSDPNTPDLPKNFSPCNLTNEQLANDSSISWGSHARKSMECCQQHEPLILSPLSNTARVPMPQQVRAGFYVNWDFKSYFTLEKNIDKLNMVLPEWFFLGLGDSVTCEIDTNAYDLLSKKTNVSVIPTLTNYFNQKWNTEATHRIISDFTTRHIFINNVKSNLKKYGFQGVNLDFDGIRDEYKDDFYAFQAELYAHLHAEGFLVTASIYPFNYMTDANILYKTNDLLFVKAYNQHYETGEPGAIADLKWVEKIMVSLSKDIENDKFVLCIPTVGMDWGKKGSEPTPLSYRAALSIAEEVKSKINFNNTTYNLDFEYTSNDSIPHKVFFTDAATNFNQIRTADNFGWKGVALYRMGAEDPRIWQFFNRDLSVDSLKNGSFNIKSLSTSIIPEDVEYVGEGEVMDVINEHPTEGAIRFTFDTTYYIISEEFYDKLPTSYTVQKYGKSADKKLVLTFDDGPDEKYTAQILDILKKENVPAAFFLIGENIEKNPDLVRRIYNDGHEIGNHTFSHPDIDSTWRFFVDYELKRTRRSIESITGHTTMLFRPPFNKYIEPRTIQELYSYIIARHNNYLVVSESIDPLDWKEGITADTILNRVIEKEKLGYGHIVLLHDAGGKKRDATIEALPKIIKHFKAQGYQFVSVANLMGKTRAELMPALAAEQAPLSYAYRTISGFLNGVNSSLEWIFYLAVFLGTFRLLFILFYAVKQKIKEQKDILPDFAPPLSIIVPAYNEEVGAVSTITSLLNQNYRDFEIVFVDDGSKDETYQRVLEAYGNHPKIQVLTKVNGGKASALNYGLRRCKNDIVVCIDADTQLDPNALYHLAKPFADAKVGAVAGNVKVGNQVNMLTRWQSIEYITAQNFDRMAFAYLNCITVVPGAIGAFRRQAIGSIGWYETDTLAEDCDLTVRIIRKGYRVTHCNEAIAITESPETYPQFLKQRFRWSFGVMQAFWKSKHVTFNRHYGALGMVAFPNILLFGLILPLLGPIADLTLLSNIIWKLTGYEQPLVNPTFYEKYNLLIIYLISMSIDLGVSAVAFIFQKEPLWKLIWLFPQRFVYRPLMYYVLFKSYIKAIKGELQGWGVLKRTGNIGQPTPLVLTTPTPQINISQLVGGTDNKTVLDNSNN
jgi:peptidoglycan-N-acetylglucosamine deacetylase